MVDLGQKKVEFIPPFFISTPLQFVEKYFFITFHFLNFSTLTNLQALHLKKQNRR